ncbi:MAG TPA: peptide ABC transporter ATP-binding protein, partial [Nitrospina sp.]|nr:peptide ABC transporter ATP-binding protein [Nitrospina sp.]
DQIMEAIRLHQDKTESQARELVLQILRQVAIPSPESRIDQYPHEL